MRRIAAVAVVSFLPTLPLFAADTVQSILDSKALQGEYNPVLVSFLLDEGKTRLPAKQHKLALDQQLAGFKEEVDIKPSEQVTAQVATLAGALLGGDVGDATADAAAEVWSDWVDAAFVLLKAGYKAETAPFFKNCIENFPYESLQGRCATGLVIADPENAMTHLTAMLAKGKPEQVTNAALRILGDVAGDEATPKAQRDAIVAELIKRTEGIMNTIYYEAAIEGLIRAKDGRAVEPLRKMTKGLGKSDEVKQAALRGLALTYKDSAALEQLRAGLKGASQLFSAVTLIEAGDAAGFEYATQKLTPQKKGLMKGLMKSKSDVDPAPVLVRALRTRGDQQSRDVLTKALEGRADNDPLWPTINVVLLELGDTSKLETVKKIVAGDYSPTTRTFGAVALAKNKDYSGIAALSAMASKPALRASVADALAEIDHADSVAPLVSMLGDSSPSVRAAAAYALTRLTNAAALDGFAKAYEATYERTPVVHAHLVRTAVTRFPKEARTKALVDKAKTSSSASVKFIALSSSGAAPTAPPPPAKKKK